MTSQAIFPFKMSSALYAVLWGGLIAGVLDTIDAVIAFRLVLGMNPIQILQYIASGALGQSRAGLAGRLGSPGSRAKMFDENLVHAIIGGKDLDCGPAELSVNLVLTRGHGSLLLDL